MHSFVAKSTVHDEEWRLGIFINKAKVTVSAVCVLGKATLPSEVLISMDTFCLPWGPAIVSSSLCDPNQYCPGTLLGGWDPLQQPAKINCVPFLPVFLAWFVLH
jgi:hypothetical protein